MLLSGVGDDFFQGGPGGRFGPRAQGISGGGSWDPKIDQFRSKFKNTPNLGLKYTKLA